MDSSQNKCTAVYFTSNYIIIAQFMHSCTRQ